MTLRSSDLGPDPVGPGAQAWRKTNVALRCSQVLHDMAVTEGVAFEELFGGVVETAISMIQGSVSPSGWPDAGAAVCREIMRRMTVR